MWTENLQICKLDLEKAKEQEIKLPTSIGSLENKGTPEREKKKIYFCFTDYKKAFDYVITTNWEILKEMG